MDALRRPGVARALADLMVCLGGHTNLPAAAPAAAPAPPAAAAPPARPKARPKAKRRVSVPPAPVVEDDRSPGERYSAWFNALPEPSRRFVTLLEERGELTVADAVKLLGLKGPKSMGGLTGAMARWAPRYGIDLPFEKREDADKNRSWVWTGRK